jgi:hypothetical protein
MDSVNNQTWGECAKSGKRMYLKDMVRDGYYPGLLVHPGWYEPPTEENERVPIFDRESITNPAPILEQKNHTVYFPLFDFDTFEVVPPLVGYSEIGNITPVVMGTPSGLSSTMNIGTEVPTVIPTITGIAANFALGTVSIFIGTVVDVTGLSSEMALGTDIPTPSTTPSGLSSTMALGSPSIILDYGGWGIDSWGYGAWGI